MYIDADTPEQARRIAQNIINAARDNNDEELDGYIEKRNWSGNSNITIGNVELER